MVNDFFLSGWTSNAYNLPLSSYTTGYSVLFALFISITLGVCVSSALATYHVACGLHDTSFLSLMRAPVFFFDTTPLGRILNRFSRDQDVIDNQLGDYFRMTVNTGFGAIFTFILLAIVSPYFLIPFVPCVNECVFRFLFFIIFSHLLFSLPKSSGLFTSTIVCNFVFEVAVAKSNVWKQIRARHYLLTLAKR